MGQEFVNQDPDASALMDLAEKISGFPLRALCFEGPMEDLTRVLYLQPALTVINLICWRQLLKLAPGFQPSFLAGHSLGEYSALVAAGVVEFKDAVPLVRLRATAMQEAVPAGAGAMAAILNLDDDKIREACAEAVAEVGAGAVVEPVNFNGPGQTVIAGTPARA